jgi:ribosomal protein S18 acetylase RimI-like enzyme
VQLVRATPSQAAELDERSHAEWGAGLTATAHVARERRLRNGLWPRSTHDTWALVDADQVLASCETYRVACTVDGEPGLAWEIASVFVEPLLRGRGYATRLLEELSARLRPEPGARALVLYSDVAPSRLYERLGFVARPAGDRVVPPEIEDPDDGPWIRFGETELADVHSRVVPFGGPGFSIWPSLAQIDWHLDRSRTRAELVGWRRSSRCGAQLGQDVVIWTEDRESDALLLLLLTARVPRAAGMLISAAARTAAELGLKEVRAWETPLPGAWPADLGAPVARNGSVPMIRPFAPDVDPEGWTFIPRGLWV